MLMQAARLKPPAAPQAARRTAAARVRALAVGTASQQQPAAPSPAPAAAAMQQEEQQAFLHGTLSTAGIAGAAPTIRSLKKQAVGRLAATLAATGGGSCDALVAAAVTGPAAALAAQQQQPDPGGDAGMRPRVLIAAAVSRPDLHGTADIPGAQPRAKNIVQRPRGTNPLEPHSDMRYTLPAASLLQLPSGPAPPDRLLRDTLDIRDIAGASPRPRIRARSAAACTRGGGSVLDVSDIEGTSPTWRPAHRHHFGLHLRDSALNVADINGCQPHPRPGPRAAAFKGHPDGPQREPAIKPRRPEAPVDNSLRTLDIEGASVVLHAPRGGRQDFHGVTDIDGAAPADRDRAHLFARRKAAAVAAEQRRCAADGALSGLLLRREQLLELWQQCKGFDRDNSGFLTAAEASRAMQAARLQLSAAEVDALTSALLDNAGLLDCRRLTRQLKAQLSRPGSAPPAQCGGSSSSGQGQQPQQLPEQLVGSGGGGGAGGETAAAAPPSSADAAGGVAQHSMQQHVPPAKLPVSAAYSSGSGRGWLGALGARPMSAPAVGRGAARQAGGWQGGSSGDGVSVAPRMSGSSRCRDVEALLPARPASGRAAQQQQLRRPASAAPPGLAERRRLAEADCCDRTMVLGLL